MGMSHATRRNESCYTYESVMSHISATKCKVLGGYGWVTSHLWISHVSPENESCHDSWHTWMSHVTRRNESFHRMSHVILTCDMTHSYVCHTWHDSFIWVPRVTWLIRMCAIYDMTHSYVCHDEVCHTSEWVMAHIWMSHATHIYDTVQGAECEGMYESWHTYEWVMSHVWLSHVTHINESCHTYEWVMSHI